MKGARMKKLPILLFILVVFFGCATKPDVYVDGSKNIPKLYKVRSFRGDLIVNMFVAMEVNGDKDVDGTVTKDLTFLQMNVQEERRVEKIDGVKMAMTVFNPHEINYGVLEKYEIQFRNGKPNLEVQSLVAYSQLKSREYYRKLPVNKDISKVSYRISIVDQSGEEILRFGDFVYRLL
jgi:hypothetical protein